MDARKVTRRTYVIDRPFQLKYTALLVVTGVGVSVLFGTMMYLIHMDGQQVLLSAAPGNEVLQEVLAQADRTLLWLIGAAAVLMGAALGILGVLITHRVAGPLYVMGSYLNQLAQGRFPWIRPLRKHDELKVFFERFQSVVETLRQKELEEANRLDQALAGLEGRPEAGASLEMLRTLRDQKRAAATPPTRPT